MSTYKGEMNQDYIVTAKSPCAVCVRVYHARGNGGLESYQCSVAREQTHTRLIRLSRPGSSGPCADLAYIYMDWW